MRSLSRFGLALALVVASSVATQEAAAQDAAAFKGPEEQWTADELENLLAPIALYPDPILAQVLIAATFPEQIAAAATYVRLHGADGLDQQPWEISVRAVARYAPVLNLMAEGPEWTIALGQAYVEQPKDVMGAVQRLRQMASEQGNLVSSDRQKVIVEREVIRIEPAQPQVIYVPTYDPAVVYFRPIYVAHAHPAYWSWGVGYPIGVWLTYDFDWWDRRVYYHGWMGGPSWVVVSRPWIVISPFYVGPRYSTIVVNRRIVYRSYDYRPLRRYTVVHRHTTFDRHGRPRREIARGERGDRDRSDWNPGRGDENRRGRDDGNPGRGDENRGGRNEANPGRGDERRRTPVPVAGSTTASRRVTPIHTGSDPKERTGNGSWNARPDRGAPVGAAAPTRSERRATPSPVGTGTRGAAPRANPGDVGSRKPSTPLGGAIDAQRSSVPSGSGYSVPRTERSVPRAERASPPRAERAAPRAERSAPRTERSAPRAERSAPRAERSAPKAERSAPRASAPRQSAPRASAPSRGGGRGRRDN